MRRLIKLIILSCIVLSNFSFASRLDHIQQQIESLKHLLSHDQNQQSNLQSQLKKIELNLGNTTNNLQKMQKNLIQQQSSLTMLNQQQKSAQQQLQKQQSALTNELKNIYLLNQQSYFKLLLNQQQPTQISRMLMYYHYLEQHRMALMQNYQTSLSKVLTTQQAVTKHTQQLKSLQNQQLHTKTQLEKIKTQREQLLTNVNNEISNKNQQLKTLIANKAALEQVLNRIQKHPITEVYPTFSTHGKLRWPTAGKIISHFGSPILQSQLKSNGVLIQAPQGQSVFAVAPGQVVFANWMAGYGLLLIIDHGNGFMSIYGRNDSIYKKVGATIKAGDLIASVGESGGYNQPALYFALRHGGQSINPEQWCG